MEKDVSVLKQRFSVPFGYDVLFTNAVFDKDNISFLKSLLSESDVQVNVMVVLDEGVSNCTPTLVEDICRFFEDSSGFNLLANPILVEGGEACKNDFNIVMDLLGHVNNCGLDRHSYLIAVGGGAVLDLVGFVAAIAHRGIRHVRIPTTVLAQNDSGIGVKNGVNLFGKKNFIGCFAPPALVINDANFLRTLSNRDWLGGISEAIKVALIKDPDFFEYLEEHHQELVERNESVMAYLIKRCADLHLQHIAGGDAFEKGSSRPLDFGHWSAHKLEQLSHFKIRHGEAVAIGIALDTIYSTLLGFLADDKAQRIINLLLNLRLPICCSELTIQDNGNMQVINGLAEFKEHIGGELTIMMLKDIGVGFEINEVNTSLMEKAIYQLQKLAQQSIVHESKAVF